MAGIATNRPTTVAINAPATPGAIAVRLAELARAIPENVSITPQTVPNKPMNGPPATAVDNTIIPFSNTSACWLAARSRATRTDSNEDGLIFVVICRARISVCAPIPGKGGGVNLLLTEVTFTG